MIVLIGCLFRELFVTIVFTITFKFLRTYAGGYHAKTRMRCSILSYATMAGVLIAIKLLPENIFYGLIVWILAGVVVLYLAPVEAQTKPLDDLERCVYRKKLIQIWSLETIAFLFFLWTGWKSCVTAMAFAGLILSISLLFGKYTIENKRSLT